MTKGRSSFGKRRSKTHTLCCRWASKAYHLQKLTCYNWNAKDKRPNTTRSGRMRRLKTVYPRFRHGFCEGLHLNPREQLLQHPVHLQDFKD
uniref:Large ribosomal subunit protein eL37 n=1 Tax=Capra hircus TaxID=9925 RepID=A0A452ELJ7_CAPHI